MKDLVLNARTFCVMTNFHQIMISRVMLLIFNEHKISLDELSNHCESVWLFAPPFLDSLSVSVGINASAESLLFPKPLCTFRSHA